MGCPISKLDNEEAVQLCNDRKRFIKQAIESRTQFAAGHIAYVQSLRRVSLALRDYIEGYEHSELSESYSTHPSTPTPMKETAPEIVAIPLKLLCVNTPNESHIRTSQVINYLISGGNRSISIEERPQSPETLRIESYSPMHRYGIEGFFTMQSPPPYNSSFSSSPYDRPSYPLGSPQTSQWDFFWNPFSFLDTYGYPTRESFDQMVANDRTELTQVRGKEGIPDLEEFEEIKENGKAEQGEEKTKIDLNCATKAADGNDSCIEVDIGTEKHLRAKGLESQATESIEVAEAVNVVELEVANEGRDEIEIDREGTKETPDFSVYVDRRLTSMEEVVKDLETQFKIICDSTKEVSTMLEASKAQFSSTPNGLKAAKMLNPIALFRSASSHSAISRPFHASTSSRDDGYDSSSDVYEESVYSGSLQSTLDKLYAWENKLYKEVKSAERIRIAYEKKWMQLKNQDSKGEECSVLDKTRAMVRDLHTQFKVSMHSVESVSKRIETLRDEELHPQLMELIQGLGRMWLTMAECHNFQKQTIQEARRLLSDTPPKLTDFSTVTVLPWLVRSATILESELRNWCDCLQTWIAAQRSFVRSLASWVLRCARPDTDSDPITRITPFSPRDSTCDPPIFPICIQWSRRLDALHGAHVLDGLDSLMTVVVSALVESRSRHVGFGVSGETKEKMELAESEEILTVDKTEEVAIKALWEGMSVAVGSLTEFAVSSAEMYVGLVNQLEKET